MLHSPRGSTPQRHGRPDRADRDPGQVGAAASRAVLQSHSLLQAALRREWPKRFRGDCRHPQSDRVHPGRAQKVDRVPDLGRRRHQRRRRAAELSYNRQDP